MTPVELKEFLSLLDGVVPLYESLCDQQAYYESELFDLDHYLEFEELNLVELRRLAQYRQKLRRERREVKEELEQLKPLYTYLQDGKGDANKKAVDRLRAVQDSMLYAVKTQATRHFTPRTISKDDFSKIVGREGAESGTL